MLIYDDVEDYLHYRFFDDCLSPHKNDVFEYVKYNFTEVLADELYSHRKDLLDEYGCIDTDKINEDQMGREIGKICRYLLRYAKDGLDNLDLDATSLHVRAAHKCFYDDIPDIAWLPKDDFLYNGWTHFSDRSTLDFSYRSYLKNLQISGTDFTFIDKIYLPGDVSRVLIGGSDEKSRCTFGKQLTIDVSLCRNMPDIYIKDRDKSCNVSIVCPAFNMTSLAKAKNGYITPDIIPYLEKEHCL